MALRAMAYAFCLAICLSLVMATPEPVIARRIPGESADITYQRIRRALADARLTKREELSDNTTLDRSWDEAVLLKFGLSQQVPTSNENASVSTSQSVEIVCTKCYAKGFAKATLNIPSDFNAFDAVNATVDAVGGEISNLTESIGDYFENYFEGVLTKFSDGIDFQDFAIPPLNYSFDVDVPAIPECNLTFQFDGMELYLQMNTILGAGASYELNLFTSQTPFGIGLGKDFTLGVVFRVDLLLSVDASIDMSHGFHIALNDGVAIDIALFGDEVANIVFNGGQFEFLPVTVESAGVVMKAILRIGIHSGFVLSSPSLPSFTILNQQIGFPTLSGGIEAGVFANLAEFVTNVTAVPNDPKCELKVVQEYHLALGAKAGASVAFDDKTWGPVAETSIPIFTTQIAEVCVMKGTPTPTAVPTITATQAARKRADMETKTLSGTVTHTVVQCVSSTTGNCPASLLTSTITKEESTITTVVPTGQDIKFPSTPGFTNASVTSTVAFGSNVQKMSATTGSPVSYTPPPTPSGGSGGNGSGSKALDGEVGGVSKKLIVGVSLGVGIPVVLAIIAGFVLYRKRQRYSSVRGANPSPAFVNDPYHGAQGGAGFEPYRHFKPAKTAGVSVQEVGRH